MRDRATGDNETYAIRSSADKYRRTGFDVRRQGVDRFGIRSYLGFLSFLRHGKRLGHRQHLPGHVQKILPCRINENGMRPCAQRNSVVRVR
jgi:hypothetical protein